MSTFSKGPQFRPPPCQSMQYGDFSQTNIDCVPPHQLPSLSAAWIGLARPIVPDIRGGFRMQLAEDRQTTIRDFTEAVRRRFTMQCDTESSHCVCVYPVDILHRQRISQKRTCLEHDGEIGITCFGNVFAFGWTGVLASSCLC